MTPFLSQNSSSPKYKKNYRNSGIVIDIILFYQTVSARYEKNGRSLEIKYIIGRLIFRRRLNYRLGSLATRKINLENIFFFITTKVHTLYSYCYFKIHKIYHYEGWANSRQHLFFIDQ